MNTSSASTTKTICDIIICVWNNCAITRECIDSIRKNTCYPYRLVLIDNGSEKETREYLEGLRDDQNLNIEIIRNEENIGNTKAGS